MKKTEQLLAAMTAAVVLANAPVLAVHASPAVFQVSPPTDESWKTDPAVADAADKVFASVKGTDLDHAQTEKDLLKLNPTVNNAFLQKALLRLIWQATVRRTGDGTADSPYRYYENTGGHEG